MKILIILGTRINLGGGMEYYFKDLAQFFNGRHQLTIVEAASGAEYTDLKRYFSNARIVTVGNKNGFDLPSFKDFKSLRKLFLENDVVYYHSGAWNIVYSAILQFLTGTPVVGLAWFITDAQKRFKRGNKLANDSPKAKFATWFFGPSLVRIGRFFKRYQVVSHKDYVYLAKSHKDQERVREITFGIDTSSYDLCEKEGRFTVIFLARLDYQKGADLLPEIFEKISSRIRDFKFRIVGDGPYLELIKELKRTNDNVEMFGYVSKQSEWVRYRKYLCSAHVFISPIRYAGTTIIALESLASGTPVVELECTGTVERIKDGYNGFIVQNIDEMAERISEIYKEWSEGSGYDEMSLHAVESAKLFEQSDKFIEVENLLIETASTKKV